MATLDFSSVGRQVSQLDGLTGFFLKRRNMMLSHWSVAKKIYTYETFFSPSFIEI